MIEQPPRGIPDPGTFAPRPDDPESIRFQTWANAHAVPPSRLEAIDQEGNVHQFSLSYGDQISPLHLYVVSKVPLSIRFSGEFREGIHVVQVERRADNWAIVGHREHWIKP